VDYHRTEGKMPIREEAEKLDQKDRFEVKTRLNLNDLLRRKEEEKRVDKKTNLIIISCVSGVAAIVLLILSL